MKRSGLTQSSLCGICIALTSVLFASCDSKTAQDASGHSSKQAKPKPAAVISQVRVDRIAFDPAKQEEANIRFNLSETSDVALSIYDGRDRLIYRQETKALEKGDRSLAWHGRDQRGANVPPEAYTYTLTASNARGQSIHDVTELTGGQPTQAKDVRWDATAGRVHYYLDQPARVNLRFGLDNGPHLRTLIDWVPRTAGAHSEAWDGKDASGVMDLTQHPSLKPAVNAYTLPDNTLFVGTAPDRIQFVSEPSAQTVRPRSGPASPKRLGNYAQQPLDTRGDLDAKLHLVGDFKQDDQGRWRVKGLVPFKVDVVASDRDRAIRRRFEAVFYVDGTFTYENELGYLPMAWNWDSSRINPGEHYITLNIRGYEGNFGTATVKVFVEASTPASASQTAAVGAVKGK